MTNQDRVVCDGLARTAPPRSRLFTIRVWTENLAGGYEHRGSVRDVTSGAFRSFREWSDLIAFMIGSMEEAENDQPDRRDGETR